MAWVIGLIIFSIVLCVLIGIFPSNEKNSSMRNEESVTLKKAKSTKVGSEDTKLVHCVSSTGQNIATGRFDNGTVWCIGRNQSYKIGSYEVDTVEGEINIYSLSGIVIGKVKAGGRFYLLRTFRNNVDSFVYSGLECVGGNSILDNNTDSIVAYCDGGDDMLGIVATFVCLNYECIMEGVYYQFYHK